MSTPSRSGAPRSRAFAALRHAGYRPFFATSSLAMMADSIEHVISYWILFEKFQSPALGGVAILTHWLPFLFLSVYFGALADRFNPRRMIQLGMVLFMLVSLGWGFLFLSDTLEIWHAVVLLSVHGLAGVLWNMPGQLLLHEIVDAEHLQSAVRLNATGRYLGLVLGPVIGSGFMLAFGPAVGLFLNVLLYLPLIHWCWKTMPPTRAPGSDQPAAARHHASDTLGLIRSVTGNRVVVSMTLLAGSASLFVGNAYQAQMPEFAHDLGHREADFSYSLLLGADALGALMAGIVLESRGFMQPRIGTAIVLTILWCIAVAGFAAATAYPLAVALMFVAGFLNLAFSAMAQTLVQLHAPAAIRGRVIGLFSMSALGLRAFSGVTVGFVGSAIGIHWSLALSALALLAVVIALAAFSIRTRPA